MRNAITLCLLATCTCVPGLAAPAAGEGGYLDPLRPAETDDGLASFDPSLSLPATGPASVLLPAVSDRRPGPYTVAIFWENDARYLNFANPSDRHYTNGAQLVIAWHPGFALEWGRALPGLGADFTQAAAAFGVVAGQAMYTPSPITVRELQPAERPYAGWLHGGVFLQRATPTVWDHLELEIGTTGEASLARRTQTCVHAAASAQEPLGWSHQLRDEIGFNLAFQRRWRLPAWPREAATQFDLVPHAGFTVGTVNRHVQAGAVARFGCNLDNDFGPATIAMPGDYTNARPKVGFYLFGSVTGKVVEHNLFIEGNTWRNSHGVDALPLVGEAAVGLVWQISQDWKLVYSQTFKSHEFRGQHGTDSYGTLMMSYSF